MSEEDSSADEADEPLPSVDDESAAVDSPVDEATTEGAVAADASAPPWRHEFLSAGHERRWPLLEPLVRRVGDVLGQTLQARFKAALPVRCQGSESVEHAPLVASLGSDTIYVARTLEPLPGEIWWLIDRAMVAGIADRWFGGTGSLSGAERPLSNSERRILDALVECLDTALEQAWAPYKTVRVTPSAGASADRFARDRPAAGRIANRFEVQLGEGAAQCSLMLLPRTLGVLERDTPPVAAGAALMPSAGLLDSVRNCEIRLTGVLAESTISLGDVMNLAPGDFIALDERQTVSFRAGGRPMFDATMGTVNGRASASVTQLHPPGGRR